VVIVRKEGGDLSRPVSFRGPFDLDDVCAQGGQQPPAKGAGDSLGDFDYFKATERQVICLPLAIFSWIRH
jgi:hypothetical protein